MSDPAHHVADKLDITEQLARYARGVDTHDWDLWRSVFTDDAIIDYSSANGRPAAGRDDTADWLADSMPFLPGSSTTSPTSRSTSTGTPPTCGPPSTTRCSCPDSPNRARAAATTTTTSYAPRPVGRANTSSRRAAGSSIRTRPRKRRRRNDDRHRGHQPGCGAWSHVGLIGRDVGCERCRCLW